MKPLRLPSVLRPAPLCIISILMFPALLVSACGLVPTPAPTDFPTLTPLPSYTPTPAATKTPTPLPVDAVPAFILSINDNGYAHLFGFSPEKLPLTRITNGQWNDVAPALSPDGKKVVFASDRNDYWDLYTLDLVSGQTARITDTPEYEGNPGWSPDSQWIVYETYLDNSMEISIQSTVTAGQTIRLTTDPAYDGDPVWSPGGRKIAFVSNRSGEDEIWLANLDQSDTRRFTDISQAPYSLENHPAWSPDGTKLAWASKRPNEPESIYVWDSANPDLPAARIGSGDWPVWSDNGSQIASRLREANQDYIISYGLDGTITTPPIPVPTLRGLDWRTIRVGSLPFTFQKAAFLTATPLWKAQIQIYTDVPNKRVSVVPLQDVQAPHAFLHDAVDEAFVALRQRAIAEVGWDPMASLADAYEPLTSNLDPGKSEDWLFTGRAFALNPLTLNAGWMLAVREDIDNQTYWRVYLRALAQDGSEGAPLSQIPWDLNARYNLDPQAYDGGGASMTSIPAGYWVDFTNLAQAYGWQRLPAQDNWRSYFAGTQFNEFAITGGMDWHTAMLQLYPPDIFITPTVVIPPTITVTVTPTGYRYKSPTPTTTFTPTPHPTFTPSP